MRPAVRKVKIQNNGSVSHILQCLLHEADGSSLRPHSDLYQFTERLHYVSGIDRRWGQANDRSDSRSAVVADRAYDGVYYGCVPRIYLLLILSLRASFSPMGLWK